MPAKVNRALAIVVLALLHLERGKMEQGAARGQPNERARERIFLRWRLTDSAGALSRRLAQLGVTAEGGNDELHPVFGKVQEELQRLETARYFCGVAVLW